MAPPKPPKATDKTKCGVVFRGKACGLTAGFGTDHPGFGPCKHHMGSTPAVSKSAYKAEVAEIVETVRLSDKRELTPIAAMLEEIARSAGAVAFFDEIVAGINPGETATPYADAVIQQWNDQRKHLANVAALVFKAGLEERVVRATEAQAMSLVTVLLAVVGSPELGLNPDQIHTARKLAAEKLRELGSAAA